MGQTLHDPVKDIRGRVLVQANQDILQWSGSAIHQGEYLKNKSKFKDMPQLLEDMSSVVNSVPYSTVLKGWAPNLREWLGEMWAPTILFEELKYHRIRDPYAYKHILTIALVGSRLLELWIKTPATVKRAFQAFMFHDLGKSRLAPAILEKTGTLEDLEKVAVYEHPLISHVLNACYWADSQHLCAEVALSHHEDRLGKGYPQGLKTNSLILDILTTVDRFDALISDRPFRFKKFTVREACDLLKTDAEGGRMDATVLKALVALLRNEKISDLKKVKLGKIGREADKK